MHYCAVSDVIKAVTSNHRGTHICLMVVKWLWGRFVGKEDMYVRDGLHLSGKGAAVFSENLLQSMDSGTGCNYLN